jgi:cytoskeletal protein CcmA (bactofilin family)
MFGKPKDETTGSQRVAAPPSQSSAHSYSAPPESPESTSSFSAGTTIVGKIVSDGTVKIHGRVEGELRAASVVISDGASVEGDLVAEDLTIGGRVKGTVHANRVKLASTAVVEGDIFHHSLAIEENARFEGSSRREDAAPTPEIPLRGHAARPAAAAAALEVKGKLNGDKDNHSGTAA